MTQPASEVDVRPAVAEALKAGRPVVAMVSSPLAHTLPWPANLEAYRQAGAAIQQEGGMLAVVAVWGGRLTVGLNAGEIEVLAKAPACCASRRDLAKAVVEGLTAATTVSASMYVAWWCGHSRSRAAPLAARSAGNGGEHVWDISADLVEDPTRPSRSSMPEHAAFTIFPTRRRFLRPFAFPSLAMEPICFRPSTCEPATCRSRPRTRRPRWRPCYVPIGAWMAPV